MTASVNMTRNISSGLEQASFLATSTLMCFHFKRLDFAKVTVLRAPIQKLPKIPKKTFIKNDDDTRKCGGLLSLLKCQDSDNNVPGCVL